MGGLIFDESFIKAATLLFDKILEVGRELKRELGLKWSSKRGFKSCMVH